MYIYVSSGFRREVAANCALLGYYVASNGIAVYIYLQTLLWATKHNLAVRGEGIHVLTPPTINPYDNINKSRI